MNKQELRDTLVAEMTLMVLNAQQRGGYFPKDDWRIISKNVWDDLRFAPLFPAGTDARHEYIMECLKACELAVSKKDDL